jgi:endo-alpha-1,4-polygalactosaminidase (GH114 family)
MRSGKLLSQHQQQQQVDSNLLQHEKETENNKGEKKMLQDLEQDGHGVPISNYIEDMDILRTSTLLNPKIASNKT